mmetsp:Transcript_66132/g.196831  ORF Transcript_66132/g.196831 Transcript_66132/m.196831 type:complete len:201 (-) Transcript_66132:1003-1605(-)
MLVHDCGAPRAPLPLSSVRHRVQPNQMEVPPVQRLQQPRSAQELRVGRVPFLRLAKLPGVPQVRGEHVALAAVRHGMGDEGDLRGGLHLQVAAQRLPLGGAQRTAVDDEHRVQLLEHLERRAEAPQRELRGLEEGAAGGGARKAADLVVRGEAQPEVQPVLGAVPYARVVAEPRPDLVEAPEPREEPCGQDALITLPGLA